MCILTPWVQKWCTGGFGNKNDWAYESCDDYRPCLYGTGAPVFSPPPEPAGGTWNSTDLGKNFSE